MHREITSLVADFKLNFQVSPADVSHMMMFFLVTLWTTMFVPALRGNILSLLNFIVSPCILIHWIVHTN